MLYRTKRAGTRSEVMGRGSDSKAHIRDMQRNIPSMYWMVVSIPSGTNVKKRRTLKGMRSLMVFLVHVPSLPKNLKNEGLSPTICLSASTSA